MTPDHQEELEEYLHELGIKTDQEKEHFYWISQHACPRSRWQEFWCPMLLAITTLILFIQLFPWLAYG